LFLSRYLSNSTTFKLFNSPLTTKSSQL
jgi:hypothetical protein